jgi:hypothetical protein
MKAKAAEEERGVFFHPFTGAGGPESEGFVVAPPLTSTDEDIAFLTAALSQRAERRVLNRRSTPRPAPKPNPGHSIEHPNKSAHSPTWNLLANR